MDKQIVELIAQFMERVNLNGKEVEAYTQCMQALKEEHERESPVPPPPTEVGSKKA